MNTNNGSSRENVKHAVDNILSVQSIEQPIFNNFPVFTPVLWPYPVSLTLPFVSGLGASSQPAAALQLLNSQHVLLGQLYNLQPFLSSVSHVENEQSSIQNTSINDPNARSQNILMTKDAIEKASESSEDFHIDVEKGNDRENISAELKHNSSPVTKLASALEQDHDRTSPKMDTKETLDDNSDEDNEQDTRDSNYKYSNKLDLVPAYEKNTRLASNGNSEYYILEKQKGKPRGKNARNIGEETTKTKTKRKVGRPLKSPRGRNAIIKREHLIKLGFALPNVSNAGKKPYAGIGTVYKAVKVEYGGSCKPEKRETENDDVSNEKTANGEMQQS